MCLSMKRITIADFLLAITFYLALGVSKASNSDDWVSSAHRRNESVYDRSLYAGTEAQGIVRLYYQNENPLWKKQPEKCYGVLVNWRRVVVPCSCVSYTENELDTRSPFNYYKRKRGTKKSWHFLINYLKPTKVRVLNESYIRIGIMRDEYNSLRNQTNNLVKVTKIKIHPKCNSFYNVNFATLELESEIEGSKLIWVNQAVKRRLAEDIEFTAVASAVSGECFVVRWVDKKSEVAHLTKHGNQARPPWLYRSIRASPSDDEDAQRPNRTLKLAKDYLTFTSWDSCSGIVCPKANASEVVRVRDDYCTNKIAGKRWCAQWAVNSRLCALPEGTPVFCHVRDFSGIIGFLYNTPFHCDHRNKVSAIMASFEEALDLVKNDIPLRHSLEYLKSLPPGYDDDYFREPVIFEEAGNDAPSNPRYSFPILVGTIISRLFSNTV